MSADLARYSRQIVLPQIGVNGQQLLLDSCVLVIGVGGLGTVASLYLAAAGVGRLILADRDRVELSNLQRQILYQQADVGRQKTEAAAARLQAQNPQVELSLQQGTLSPDILQQRIREADLVLDCSDNFSTRFAVNAACVAARTPLVSGAAIRFEGQLLVCDPRDAHSPCYACLFGESGDNQDRCEEAGVLGPVVGTIGSLQALEAIKLLTGLPSAVGQLQTWDALKSEWRKMLAPADPDCRVCGH